MSGQIPNPMGSIVLVTTLLLWGMGMGGTAVTARADDCLTAPNSPAPEGKHWYYHVDQANQRKCWYLHATDQPAQHTAARRTSGTASPTATTAVEKPATDLASASTTIKPGDSAPVPLPRVKPQRAIVSAATTGEPAQKTAQRQSPSTKPAATSASAPVPTAPDDSAAPPLRGSVQAGPSGGATTDQAVQPSAQNESAVSSIVNPLAAQLRLSQQINEQGGAPAPADNPAWPNPPADVDKTRASTAPSSDAQVEAGQPTKDPKASNDLAGTAQASTTSTDTGVAASLTSTPVAIFPVVALALLVAGFLLRIVVKVIVGRRHRIAVDHQDFGRINDPQAHESPDDQIVGQRVGLTDYLQRSSKAVTSTSGPLRPSQVSDERLKDAPHTTSLRMDKINKRERRPFGIDRFESERMDDKRHQRKWRNDEPHHRSPSINPRESAPIDDHHQQGRRDDQHQRGPVGTGDELIDDLQRSLVAGPSNHRTSPPLQDDWSNDGGSRGAASSDEIREREEALEQLRRSLDQLLQSPNVS